MGGCGCCDLILKLLTVSNHYWRWSHLSDSVYSAAQICKNPKYGDAAVIQARERTYEVSQYMTL